MSWILAQIKEKISLRSLSNKNYSTNSHKIYILKLIFITLKVFFTNFSTWRCGLYSLWPWSGHFNANVIWIWFFYSNQYPIFYQASKYRVCHLQNCRSHMSTFQIINNCIRSHLLRTVNRCLRNNITNRNHNVKSNEIHAPRSLR